MEVATLAVETPGAADPFSDLLEERGRGGAGAER